MNITTLDLPVVGYRGKSLLIKWVRRDKLKTKTIKNMKVKIKSTGDIIEVYKHRERSTYINANNCTDEYKKEELTFL